MDLVLVGLPGSGKSVVGRRLANRHHATFIDLDERIETEAGRSIPDIFAEDGEPAFRAMERRAVAALGPADPDPALRRVIATGGGAVVDPRNRWRLYRGRASVWLDGRPEVLAQRLRRSPHVRPLVQGRDPIGAIRDLQTRRERFYAAAGLRLTGVQEVGQVVEAIDGWLAGSTAARRDGATLLDATTPIGRIVLTDGAAHAAVDDALRRLEARRVIGVSEPGAFAAVGSALVGALRGAGWTVEVVTLPEGEAAKRLAVVEAATSELARLRVQRDEPILAIGGGALGDTAGFIAATYLRGVPIVHVPTTLVAQIDSSIGGKTAVDLPEGKNLVGAFHQPAAIVIDARATRTLPERQRRAALAEAVKMAALGDERLFELLEHDGPAIARGDASADADGLVAEVVERCAWAKVEVVVADERERSGAGTGRISLNLGHSLGHAVEAAAGFGDLLHGEAVAYGLRAAGRIGVAMEVSPPERIARIDALLDALGLGVEPLPYPVDDVLAHLATDKKHAGGRMRWVLPTATGVEVRSDVPEALVREAATAMLGAGSVS
jgi:3-dehydroquinate synthetase/shikimate kinase